MKTMVVVLFVALVLVWGSFQADAKRLSYMERQPLNYANLDKKNTVVVPDNKGAAAANKGAQSAPETKTSTDTKTDSNAASADNAAEDDGEVNESYNNYGQDPESTSHRYFPCEQRQADSHCR